MSLSEFVVPRDVAQADRAAHNERRKVAPTRERSSMAQWMRFLMQQGGAQEALQKKFGGAPPPRLHPDEIMKHNTADDCWMVVKGVVYDVSQFHKYHPGGSEIIVKYGGKEATELFDAFHQWVNCESMLGPCVVGLLG